MSKRYRADYHIHSNHSPDCKVPIDELCQTAVTKGFQEIVITDHFEFYTPGHPVGFFTPKYIAKIMDEIEAKLKASLKGSSEAEEEAVAAAAPSGEMDMPFGVDEDGVIIE